MNKYTIKYVWLPILILSGCTASLQQRVDKTDNADSKRLEKRIDDLSGTITLIVNDTNRLHNKIEAVMTSNKAFQQKIEGLEATVRNLDERIVSLSASAETLEIVQPSVKETEIKPQLPLTDTDTSKPSEKPEPDIQKTVNVEDQLAVAKGFWDAMNAKDIQAVRLYVTKESAGKLQIKDKDVTANCKVTFGNIKIEDNKITIDTTMQTSDGTTEFEVQIQTILVKEHGQWKVDADQTMMSVFGGAMGEMMKGLGKALEEGFKKGFEKMGKSMAEGMQKSNEGMTQTSETKPDIIPPKQETVLISESAKRELFLKDNIVRLAEAEFPDNKGVRWTILSLEHKAHLTYVIVEPNPATRDYPRFKFVVSFKNPEMPRVIGTYCFKDGQYSLFSAKKK